MKIMGLLKANEQSEAGAPPSKESIERMGAFLEEITKAGVMLGADGLHPSVKGKRVRLSKGGFTITDGPFAETKELVSSYALFQVDSMDEAVRWTKRFLEVLGEGECELRPIFEPTDFSSDVFSPEEAAKEDKAREQMKRNAARQ